VRWDAPSNDGYVPITGYTVYYKEKARADDYKEIKGTGLSMYIEYLKADTDYEFKITAENAVGSSAYSLTIDGKTQVSPPDDSESSTSASTVAVIIIVVILILIVAIGVTITVLIHKDKKAAKKLAANGGTSANRGDAYKQTADTERAL